MNKEEYWAFCTRPICDKKARWQSSPPFFCECGGIMVAVCPVCFSPLTSEEAVCQQCKKQVI